MASYVVTAPLAVIKQENSTFVHVYAGGPVPADSDAAHVKQLLREKLIDKVSEPKAETPASGPTVEEILAAVGDDKAKAAEALEQEKAGKNRSTLVSKLEAIVNA